MTLRVLGPGDPATTAGKQDGPLKSPGTRVAPQAPRSRGALPTEFASQLRSGEALVWWDEKAEVSWRPVLWTGTGALAILAGATLLAPAFWSQSWREIWKPVSVVLSPVALVFGREVAGRCSVLITDSSIIVVNSRGTADRIAFRNVRRVRRDILTGGVRLEGAQHRVRIPPTLLESTRRAIASQVEGRIQDDPTPVDDPLGWMPK
ncbi:MAG: hypothetical protein V3V08_15965 [Nannocystaceae bacterium]